MKKILLVIEILQSLIRRRAWEPLMAGCTSSEPQGKIHRRSTSSRWSMKCFRMRRNTSTCCTRPPAPSPLVLFVKSSSKRLTLDCYVCRENWNGTYSTAVISKPVGTRTKARQVPLTPLYSGKLPISEAKHADLQLVLKTFCSLQAQQFNDDPLHAGGMLILMGLIWTVPLLRIEK